MREFNHLLDNQKMSALTYMKALIVDRVAHCSSGFDKYLDGGLLILLLKDVLSWYISIPLPTYSSEAGSVDVFRGSREHFRVNSQVSDRFKFSLLDSHHLSCETLAHSAGLLPARVRVDSSCAVVATFPADRDGGVVAKLA